MSIQLQKDEFNHLRNHLHRKPQVEIVAKTASGKYQQKRNSRIKREEFIKTNKEAKALFNWIFEIQAKLKLDSNQFIVRINKYGGKISTQTLSLWRRNRGHYPCDKNYRALLRLSKEANLVRIEIKNLVKETTSNLILK